MAERIGTPLQGPVRIKSTLTPKPIAYSNEIAGGPWNVTTVAQMHAIETYYRRDDANNPLWGATCYVHTDPVSANNGRYELVRGLVDNNIDNNDNWQKVSSGTGGSSLTAAQVKALYESNPDTEVFTTAEKTKLAGISGMTPAQIKASYESNANTEAFTTAEKAKLALQSGSNTGDETNQSILGKLLNNPDVNIVTDAEKGVIGSISGVNTGDETPEAVLTKLLTNENTEQFTTAHRNKLEELEDAKWKGSYTNLVGLQAAYPVGQEGWEADVDAGVGDPVQRYIWDESDQQWEAQVGTSTTETAASVKAKYESNVNTNAYDDASKAKVDNLSGVNTGDESPVAVKTKLLQNPDTNNFGDAEVLKLSGIEANATGDQTAPEIRNLLNTLIGDDRLPHTSVKGVPTVINSLTSNSTTDALAAIRGKEIKDLVDKQFYLGFIRNFNVYPEDEDPIILTANGFKEDFYQITAAAPGPSTNNVDILVTDSPPQPRIGYVTFDSGLLDDAKWFHTYRLKIGSDSENNFEEIKVFSYTRLVYKFYRHFTRTYWELVGDSNKIIQPKSDGIKTLAEITTSRDVSISHSGYSKVCPVNSVSNITLTVQPDFMSDIPIETTINYKRRGVGEVQIVAGSGVTIESIRNNSGEIKIAAQYGFITLYKEAENLWSCFGGLETT